MTEEELEEVITDCPRLFHMAESGSWDSIRERGLLSTSALLDLYEISDPDREAIESTRRPTSISSGWRGIANGCGPGSNTNDRFRSAPMSSKACKTERLV